jgi:hypothetical protein
MNILRILSAVFLLFTGCTVAPPPARPAKAAAKSSLSRTDRMTLEEKYHYNAIAPDTAYGYSEDRPVNCAYHRNGGDITGAVTEYYFLDHLVPANGGEMEFTRKGSCCQYASANDPPAKFVLLDIYEVKTPAGTRLMYLNLYDDGEVYPPRGFRFKKMTD